MKRIATIVLTILLAAAMMTTAVFAAEGPGANITSVSGKPGDTVTLTVSLTGFEKLAQLAVEVDAGALTHVYADSKWVIDGKIMEIDEDKAIWAVENPVNVNKDMLQLVFKLPDAKSFAPPYEVKITVITAEDTRGSAAVAVGCDHKNNEINTATCTKNGYIGQECEYCGNIEVETYVSALGHDWKTATCTDAKTCKTCGATEGKALGHDWKAATCTDAKTCKTCGATEGKALGHDWKAATCTDAKTCKTCGATEGKALGHDWKAATCTDAKTCKVCGATEGNANGHSYTNGICGTCGAKDPDYVEPKPEAVVNRLAGSNRHDTALQIAEQTKEALGINKFDSIIVAAGYNFADALAGSYLSTVKQAPILLSFGGGGKYAYLDTNNIDYIEKNLKKGGTVYILGGEAAVPASYDKALKSSGYVVDRLAGKDRFETNIMILKKAGVKPGQEILVCTATEYADALSASATGLPILLVFNQKGALYGGQPDYLASLGGKNNFCIIGGSNAVGAKLEKALGQYGKVTRLAGTDRLQTSVMVAQKYFPKATSAVVAYGWNYPDGLCGGGLAYAMKAPLLLTYSAPKYYAIAADYTAKQGIKSGMILGGETLVSRAAALAILKSEA